MNKDHFLGLAVALSLALCVVVSLVTWRISSDYYTRQGAAAHSALSARDQKILAVIVKKNPQAAIRDFADFPAFLVEQSESRGLDYRYVMAIIEKESEWNPRAVSPAGAVGLMQVMPPTGAAVAKNLSLQFEPPSRAGLGTLGDPRSNLVIGLAHLRGLIDSYGLGPAHLRAYNRGDVAARQHWPGDRYAEDVALRFVALAAHLRENAPAPQEVIVSDRPTYRLPSAPAPPVSAPGRPDVLSQRAQESAQAPASPARVAGEAAARGLVALMAATAARFPSLVEHKTPGESGLPTLVFQAPDRDADGILLPRRFHARASSAP